MSSSEFKGTAADARVRLILDDLYSQLEEAFYAIGRIAEAEVERLGEDTPEGDAWKSFAAGGALTPAGSGLTTAMKEIAAIRGELVYRELDSNQVGYVPLNQREQSQPNDEDDEDLE